MVCRRCMNKLFYPRLAATYIKKNGKFYFPYFLTCVGCISMFYIMCAIANDDGIRTLPGAKSLETMMHMGCFVIGLFSVIFLYYTNSFLMKRRKKELGLFNILGMEKRHIAKIMMFESIDIAVTSMITGLLCGVVLSKLIALLLGKILNLQIHFNLKISLVGVVASLILFGIIFALTLIANLTRIQLSKPIELLYGGNVGEREPRTKWLIALIGFGCIGIGYYMAITVKSPLAALPLFFIAVILVIIGTYCLFTAGSIAILKMLRSNKKFYYQTKHFTSISGMIYRMKQNSVGLANICILSTMVLVMVSGTVSLYMGMEDSLNTRYPTDITICKLYDSDDDLDRQVLLGIINREVET